MSAILRVYVCARYSFNTGSEVPYTQLQQLTHTQLQQGVGIRSFNKAFRHTQLQNKTVCVSDLTHTQLQQRFNNASSHPTPRKNEDTLEIHQIEDTPEMQQFDEVVGASG